MTDETPPGHGDAFHLDDGDGMVVRAGGVDDTGLVLALLDEAVAWMVARRQTGQWGSTAWSAAPERVDRIRRMCAMGLWVAEIRGAAVGALVLGGDPPPWIPECEEPHNYIQLLVTSRAHSGTRIGARLIAFAKARTRAAGIHLLRVDCWAGDNGRLVDYYKRSGFSPAGEFRVGDWPGQVLQLRP